jgi:predicted unusual protein kinase regulating ubiquinone biosynthesis (AarF/ABC1/UbiB family)
VYKGVLELPSGKKQDVAVKLIHPHVKKLIAVDMDIMRFLAHILELFPSIEYLSMADIVEEFAKVWLSTSPSSHLSDSGRTWPDKMISD